MASTDPTKRPWGEYLVISDFTFGAVSGSSSEEGDRTAEAARGALNKRARTEEQTSIKIEEALSVEGINSLCTRYPHLQELIIAFPLKGEILEKIPSFAHLRTLQFECHCPELDDKRLVDILRNAKHLRNLKCEKNPQLIGNGFGELPFLHLREIGFNTTPISFRNLLLLIGRCPGIKKLDYSYCSSNAGSHNPRDCDDVDQTLLFLPELPLEELDLSNQHLPARWLLTWLQKCPNLKALYTAEEGVQALTQVLHYFPCTKLTHLVADYGSFSSQHMIEVALHCPKLEIISCADNPCEEEFDWIGLETLDVMKNVKVISLEGQPIDDEQLLLLVGKCPKLEELNIDHTNVSKERVDELKRVRSNLTIIWNAIDDSSGEAVSETNDPGSEIEAVSPVYGEPGAADDSQTGSPVVFESRRKA